MFLSVLLEALMAEGTMIDMGDGFGGMSLLSIGAIGLALILRRI